MTMMEKARNVAALAALSLAGCGQATEEQKETARDLAPLAQAVLDVGHKFGAVASDLPYTEHLAVALKNGDATIGIDRERAKMNLPDLRAAAEKLLKTIDQVGKDLER